MKYPILPSLFYIVFSIAVVLAVSVWPALPILGYGLLCFLFLISLFVGYAHPGYLALSTAVAIPILIHLTVASLSLHGEFAIQMIMASVMFSLGFAVAYPSIVSDVNFSQARHTAEIFFFLFLSMGIGVGAGYVLPSLGAHTALPWAWQIALLLYLAIAEEFMFRGAILRYASAVLHPLVAIIVTTLLYGALYISSTSLVPFGIALIASFSASVLYSRTNRLWPVIVFTFIWKLISFAMLSGAI